MTHALTYHAFSTPKLGRIQRDAPILFSGGVFVGMLSLPFWLAGILDPRLLDDVNIWAKPLKFAVALSVFLLTLAFFARLAPARFLASRWTHLFHTAVVFAVIVEMIWIAMAAMWGVRSHFNFSTPAMETIYLLMGAFAILLTSASLVMGLAILRQSTRGLSLAVGVSLIATFMLTCWVASDLANNGGRFVGGSSTDLLPVMGWARDMGDLRVSHFFATHVMHIAPALALIFAIAGVTSRAAMVIPTIGMGALVAFTFFQAKAGEPFLAWLG